MLQAVALAWLTGSAFVAYGLPVWTGFVAGLLAVRHRRRASPWRRVALALALVVVSLGGAVWYHEHLPAASPSDVSHSIRAGPRFVRGVVEGDRDEREHVLQLRFRVWSVDDGSGPQPASGLVLLRLPLSQSYDDGDALELRGKLVDPPQAKGFDYRAYLAREGIFAEMNYPSARLLRHDAGPRWRHVLVKLRERLVGGVAGALPEPEASLGAGIALGTRRVIEPTLNTALTTTGTAQIVVASGYNITIVSTFVLWLLAWLIGRRWALWLTLAGISAYSLFVGLYPSVVRAAIMGFIVVFAQMAGRPHSGMRALLIASAVLVAISPSPWFAGVFGTSPLALNDVSFLLSFFGTAGLFLFAEPLTAAFGQLTGRSGSIDRSSLQGVAAATGAATVAAMAGSTPVILGVFHTFSPSQVPANLILFPFVPAIMAASAATAVAGAIWHPAALVFAPLAYVLLAFMAFVARLFAGLPASQFTLGWFGLRESLITLVLGGFLYRSGRRAGGTVRPLGSELVEVAETAARCLKEFGGRALDWIEPAGNAGAASSWQLPTVAFVAIVAVGALAFVVPRAAQGASPPLKVTYLNVGQGSAILVQSGTQRVLVDGGPPGEATLRALDRELRPWERSLNLIVLTDRSPGHAGGLAAVLGRYRVGAAVDATAAPAAQDRGGFNSVDVQQVLSSSHALQVPRAPSTVFQLGEAEIAVTSAAPATRADALLPATVIARLGARRLVLAGDTTASAEADVRSVNRANASRPVYPPRIVVLESAEPARTSAPPSTDDVPPGSMVYRTSENGDVTVEVTTHELRVHVEHGPRLGILAGAP